MKEKEILKELNTYYTDKSTNKYMAKKLFDLFRVTGSVGVDTKPVLMTLERTYENKDITICDLCRFNEECEWNEKRYHKCCTENTDDQYYL